MMLMKRQPDPMVTPEHFERALSTLPERERDILTARYSLTPEPAIDYRVLAKRYGVYVYRVQATEAKARRKMKHPERGVYLPEPIDPPLDPSRRPRY